MSQDGQECFFEIVNGFLFTGKFTCNKHDDCQFCNIGRLESNAKKIHPPLSTIDLNAKEKGIDEQGISDPQ